jgi:uncharacterized membrane protein
MNADDLDRILASEEPLLPSSGFAASTLERVRESASAPPPLPFPWRRFLLGLLAMLALSGLCGGIAVRLHLVETLRGAIGGALADPHLLPGLAGAGASLLGTYLLVRLTLSFTRMGR